MQLRDEYLQACVLQAIQRRCLEEAAVVYEHFNRTSTSISLLDQVDSSLAAAYKGVLEVSLFALKGHLHR